jgi:DNA-binding transcriptional regulator YbjK
MSSHRDRIVAATAESLRHRGFNGTSLKDITSAAGAPTGSVYHFFSGGGTELAVAGANAHVVHDGRRGAAVGNIDTAGRFR